MSKLCWVWLYHWCNFLIFLNFFWKLFLVENRRWTWTSFLSLNSTLNYSSILLKLLFILSNFLVVFLVNFTWKTHVQKLFSVLCWLWTENVRRFIWLYGVLHLKNFFYKRISIYIANGLKTVKFSTALSSYFGFPEPCFVFFYNKFFIWMKRIQSIKGLVSFIVLFYYMYRLHTVCKE